MRMSDFSFLAIAVFSLGLSGCSFMPLGPDLEKAPTPFGNASTIRLIPDVPDSPPIEIKHMTSGDSALIPVTPMSKDKPFNAAITYYRFTANTDDNQDYWLAGANIFQTADRSAYVVIRYPHGAQFLSGSDTNAEMLIVSCAMRGVYPPFTTPREEDALNNTTAAASSDYQNENGWSTAPSAPDDKACDFNSKDELYAFLPQLIRTAFDEAESNKKKSKNDQSSNYEWQSIRIVIP